MKNTIRILLILGFTHLNTSAYTQKSALQWATYFGGSSKFTSANGTYTGGIATDDSGNVYVTGQTYSVSGIATNSAYQTVGDSINGDAFLAKFSSSGKLVWATYYGGSGEENGINVVIDKHGGIYISGYTASTSGIASSGAYQTSHAGNFDAFLAKFNSSGNFLWGTYFGGIQDDECNGASVDTSGNIYIAGYSLSTSGIATSGAYQTSKGGTIGSGDGFLAKFNPSGSIVWATYFGGNKGSNIYDISTDVSGNIYMTGNTSSTSGIATSGAYQTSIDNSHAKIFLVKFSPNDSLIWGTYYGGNKDDDEPGITTDKFGNVYITGETTSPSGIATSGAYQTSYGGNYDAFLAKFSTTGNMEWSTYYGGIGFEDGIRATTDTSGNVYFIGYTNGSPNLATTGAYQVSNAGYDDVFLAKFSTNGSRLWATYYGGNDPDYGFGLASDKLANIYISGYTYSLSGIATSGAYQTSGNTTDGDGFLAKFKIQTYGNDAGISSIVNPITSFCADSMAVQVQLENFGIDTLKSVKIEWEINSKLQPAYDWTGSLKTDSSATVSLGKFLFATGIDTIIAWTTKPNGVTDSFSDNDTARGTDSVNALPKAFTGNNKSICLGNNIKIGGNPVAGDRYSWVSNPRGFISTLSNPAISPTITTTYYLTESDTFTGCHNSDSITITVNPLPSAYFTFKTSTDTTFFIPKDTNYAVYSWAFGDSHISNMAMPIHRYSHDSIYVVSLTVIDKNGCNSNYSTKDTISHTGLFEENSQAGNILIAPNPFTNKTMIIYSLQTSAAVNIAIYDITGRSVAILGDAIQKEGQYQIAFDASKYSSGIYLIKIQIADKITFRKVIKTNA